METGEWRKVAIIIIIIINLIIVILRPLTDLHFQRIFPHLRHLRQVAVVETNQTGGHKRLRSDRDNAISLVMSLHSPHQRTKEHLSHLKRGVDREADIKEGLLMTLFPYITPQQLVLWRALPQCHCRVDLLTVLVTQVGQGSPREHMLVVVWVRKGAYHIHTNNPLSQAVVRLQTMTFHHYMIT